MRKLIFMIHFLFLILLLVNSLDRSREVLLSSEEIKEIEEGKVPKRILDKIIFD